MIKRSPSIARRSLFSPLCSAACYVSLANALPDMKWWYREPAGRYWEGLPLSDGRPAAIVYGRTRDELIPIDYESLWSGSPYNPNSPEGLPALPGIRQLLLAGDYVKAEATRTGGRRTRPSFGSP